MKRKTPRQQVLERHPRAGWKVCIGPEGRWSYCIGVGLVTILGKDWVDAARNLNDSKS